MSSDNFEKKLQQQPLRQVPGEWRVGILAAARQASSAQHATRNRQPPCTSPSLLSTLRCQLSALLWPHPAAWAGLAAVWLMILGLNHATSEVPPRTARRDSPPSPQVFMAFQEQQRLLAELLGPREAPAAERPKPAVPPPRSESRWAFAIA